MEFKKFLLLLIGVAFLAGCSSSPRYASHSSSQSQVSPMLSAVNLKDRSAVKKQLMIQFNRWKGTPYQYGGTTMRGVDCSAFVQNTFHAKLGYKIPRTTRTQIKVGQKVSKSRLKVGDIVFFKTGRKSLHNGIYLGDSKFMHASSSKGVIISTLKNSYWKRTYYASRRIVSI